VAFHSHDVATASPEFDGASLVAGNDTVPKEQSTADDKVLTKRKPGSVQLTSTLNAVMGALDAATLTVRLPSGLVGMRLPPSNTGSDRMMGSIWPRHVGGSQTVRQSTPPDPTRTSERDIPQTCGPAVADLWYVATSDKPP
jgi:hypothetical protein